MAKLVCLLPAGGSHTDNYSATTNTDNAGAACIAARVSHNAAASPASPSSNVTLPPIGCVSNNLSTVCPFSSHQSPVVAHKLAFPTDKGPFFWDQRVQDLRWQA